MVPMTQPKKTAASENRAGTHAANTDGVPKSNAALRKAAREFIVRHKKTYETLAK
jgi:hypothetical protein